MDAHTIRTIARTPFLVLSFAMAFQAATASPQPPTPT